MGIEGLESMEVLPSHTQNEILELHIPSKYIQNAVDQMASLPGVGKKTALRLVLDLLKRDQKDVEKFANSFLELINNIKKCRSCGVIADQEICNICMNPKRDVRLICVVEDLRDVLAIEATESFQGLYHVLGGVISPMDGVGPGDLNLEALIGKANSGELHEIILALSATMEGDTTNFYIYKKVADSGVKISALSRGVAVGTELYYADEITLGRSIIQRTPYLMK
jgi:recombination protein RecR